MDRWPPYGGGREGRFDCIYIKTLFFYFFSSIKDLIWIENILNRKYPNGSKTRINLRSGPGEHMYNWTMSATFLRINNI